MANRQVAAAEGTTGRGLLKTALPLIVDIAIPVALYYLLHAEGLSNVAALTVSGAVPALHTVWGLVRNRRPDAMAVLMTGLFVVTLILALVSGNARFFLVKESFATGVAGVWILATAFRARNIAYESARPVITLGRPEAVAAWERLAADRHGAFRAALRRVSILWGVGLIVEALCRVFVALHYPVHTAVGLINIPIIVIICALCALSGPVGGISMKRLVEREVTEYTSGRSD